MPHLSLASERVSTPLQRLWHWRLPVQAGPGDLLNEAEQSALRERVLVDVCQRARLASPLYVLVWLVITLFSDWYQEHAWFVALNAGVFALTGLARVWLGHHVVRLVHRRYVQAQALVVSIALSNALHWGLLVAAAILWPPMQVLKPYMLFAVTGISLAGTMALAIHPPLRLPFPIVCLGPLIVALLMSWGDENGVYLGLLGSILIYLLTMSRVVLRDYWRVLTMQTLLARRAEQLTELSITDGLTGLRNRAHFNQRLNEEWLRAARQRTPLTLVLLDVDHFKQVNDTHGHQAGDACLRNVAAALQTEAQRPGDFVARYGGEEFAILLAETTREGGLAVAQRLLERLRQTPVAWGPYMIELTASAGVASCVPDDLQSAERLLRQADLALYQAKNSGRDRAVAWTAAQYCANATPEDPARHGSVTSIPHGI